MPCPSKGPKLFWMRPNCFGHVQVVLDSTKRFEHGSKCEIHLGKVVFGLVQNILTCLNSFGQVQNNFDFSLDRPRTTAYD